MSGTGRLTATLGLRSQQIVYGPPAPRERCDELHRTTEIDRAHLVMLVEQGLIPVPDAALLLAAIAELRRSDFAPLWHAPVPRGLYLAYENHLIDLVGADAGGKLHTGRSRNDLKATITALRLRDSVSNLLGEVNRLRAVLLARARAYRAVTMPLHTHYQPALPATYGYYLLGVAVALARDAGALARVLSDLYRCPLGAGALTGTDLPIDPARTARFLGFAEPPLHAVDAVASRDTCLHALAAATGAGLTVSRLAADLNLWSTVEYGYLTFPDRLVGGSSAMPQKRNAFLLEHVKSRPAATLGAWTALAATTIATPFTNSIEIGTDGVAAVWPGLAGTTDAIRLSQVVVSGARPRAELMAAGAQTNFVTATAIANQLVRRGVAFRTAHRQVGAAVRTAVAQGKTELDLPGHPDLTRASAAPGAVAKSYRHGGGPGEFGAVFAAAHSTLAGDCRWLGSWLSDRRRASHELNSAVTRLVEMGSPDVPA